MLARQKRIPLDPIGKTYKDENSAFSCAVKSSLARSSGSRGKMNICVGVDDADGEGDEEDGLAGFGKGCESAALMARIWNEIKKMVKIVTKAVVARAMMLAMEWDYF